MIYAGVDIAKTDHVIGAVDEHGPNVPADAVQEH